MTPDRVALGPTSRSPSGACALEAHQPRCAPSTAARRCEAAGRSCGASAALAACRGAAPRRARTRTRPARRQRRRRTGRCRCRPQPSGKARGIEHAEGRAPRVPEDRHAGLVEPLAHRVDQLVEIGDELLDGHRGWGCRGRRLAGAALIPVDDREALLQRRVEAAGRDCSLSPGRRAAGSTAGWRRSRLGSSPIDRPRRGGDSRSRRCCRATPRRPIRGTAASFPDVSSLS